MNAVGRLLYRHSLLCRSSARPESTGRAHHLPAQGDHSLQSEIIFSVVIDMGLDTTPVRVSVYCFAISLFSYTLIKKKTNFPHILGNSDGIGCKVIYEEGLPNT